MLRRLRRLLTWARLWPPPPDPEHLTAAQRERLLLLVSACCWCGGHACDSRTPDSGEPVHLNVRPYCQRQRDALAAHGRRS